MNHCDQLFSAHKRNVSIIVFESVTSWDDSLAAPLQSLRLPRLFHFPSRTAHKENSRAC